MTFPFSIGAGKKKPSSFVLEEALEHLFPFLKFYLLSICGPIRLRAVGASLRVGRKLTRSSGLRRNCEPLSATPQKGSLANKAVVRQNG